MDGSAKAARPIAFRKMHGAGNDFVIIDQRAAPVPLTRACLRAIADRHRGVGFDQLAEICRADDATARVVFWNADGSRAQACGNATRCIADLLMAETGLPEVTLASDNGLLSGRRRPDGLVEVDMGPPHLDWRDIPLSEPTETLHLPIDGAPAACSMGNPHCTLFVDDAEAVEIERFGPALEHHPLFPERTNVQFVEVLSRARARVRVWERGVGVTLASGSSSCAVLVNAVRRGLMDRRATMVLDGGEIEVTWRKDGHLLMAGPVARVFEGTLAPAFLEAHA